MKHLNNLMGRFKLAWIGFTKPHLTASAISLTRLAIDKPQTVEMTTSGPGKNERRIKITIEELAQ